MIDIFDNFYKGKRVLVTGHTGFKGSWLSIWLHELGAEVVGVGIVIEKAFQKGRENLENKGIRVESLVSIEKIENGKVYFAK